MISQIIGIITLRQENREAALHRCSCIWVFWGGCRGLAGEHPCGGMISIELHSNSVGIRLPHGCSPVGLLRLSWEPSCGSTSKQLLLNEALLMHHFFCQTANQVSV